MYYGIYTPNYGAEMSAQAIAELANDAEEAGWDGFFIWDHIQVSKSLRVPVLDPWVTLTAMAVNTKRIRLGTTVTPLARRRPWKLARETVTLDHLSQGRLILTVGLGHPPEAEFAHFGEDPDAKVRAAKLDEGLDILVGLWRGKPFSYHGQYYQIEKSVFLPPTFQAPRIPIWVGGYWPSNAPFRRAARWDGAFPLKSGGTMKKKDLEDIRLYIQQHRTSTAPFDLVMMGYTPGNDRAKAHKLIAPYWAGGLTWWLESLFRVHDSIAAMRQRIRQGPPKME
jgi:alkanesulfonate monooxygenase SsuD/methylene tetrahydromethanopterin reductase-like flavin-dependent oxidoreductase (luciferase family)